MAEVPEVLGRAGLGAGAVTGHGNRAVVPSSPLPGEGLGSRRYQGPLLGGPVCSWRSRARAVSSKPGASDKAHTTSEIVSVALV